VHRQQFYRTYIWFSWSKQFLSLIKNIGMKLKQKVYERCNQLVNEKISQLQQNLQVLRESAANETKSTAGDKHETALAMLQIEQENKIRQLKELLLQKVLLQQLDVSARPISVMQGSLVKTNKGYLYITVALGKVIVDDQNVIVLSLESPLGQRLKGLKVNETATINNTSYTIESIE
jgi:transcription elongation GreA/GreB family factor